MNDPCYTVAATAVAEKPSPSVELGKSAAAWNKAFPGKNVARGCKDALETVFARVRGTPDAECACVVSCCVPLGYSTGGYRQHPWCVIVVDDAVDQNVVVSRTLALVGSLLFVTAGQHVMVSTH